MFEKGDAWKVRMQSWNITPAPPAETKWTRSKRLYRHSFAFSITGKTAWNGRMTLLPS
jgi:hypothetical protein